MVIEEEKRTESVTRYLKKKKLKPSKKKNFELTNPYWTTRYRIFIRRMRRKTLFHNLLANDKNFIFILYVVAQKYENF